MAGRTPREAVSAYTREIQRTFSCVTPVVLTATPSEVNQGQIYTLNLGDGTPVFVQGPMRLSIRVVQAFQAVSAEPTRGPYKVTTRSYMYSVDNAEGKEMFGYHWQPNGLSHVRLPHLHLGAACQTALSRKMHFPTGRIAVEDFVELLIEGLEVKPLKGDWKTVIGETREKWNKWKTW